MSENIEEKVVDEWEKKLDTALEELNSCQNSRGFNSCKDCVEFFECVLRKKYIIAVYESMNKGSGGGFEF